ncbi:DUF6171 family protein [Gorillibacterium timonense]|uniref:DUF6171 family protein n=1 Tax=Gorillibacterium timonense TaxID=1689269 RepID=UPI0009E965EB
MTTGIHSADPCKGCRETVRPSSERIAALVEKIRKQSDRVLVTEEEYNKRLALCRSCESLQYDSTCKHCGCLVEIRSLQQESDCPYPFASKWRMHEGA